MEVVITLVGELCNFLGSVSSQQKSKATDQGYSSVMAQNFIPQAKETNP